jgi:hypothetical protein
MSLFNAALVISSSINLLICLFCECFLVCAWSASLNSRMLCSLVLAHMLRGWCCWCSGAFGWGYSEEVHIATGKTWQKPAYFASIWMLLEYRCRTYRGVGRSIRTRKRRGDRGLSKVGYLYPNIQQATQPTPAAGKK